MKLAIVSLCFTTLAELLMKVLRRESSANTAWIYRRLWNDTVFDCWSLRLPVWSAACRSGADVFCSQSRVGAGHERGLYQRIRENFLPPAGSGTSTPRPTNHPLTDLPRPDKKRRRNGQSSAALAQPRIIHIRATMGLLGWLPALLGTSKQENG